MTNTTIECTECHTKKLSIQIMRGRKYYWCHKCHKFFDLDNHLEVKKEDMSCALCCLPPTKDGHDPCIRDLPGVAYACCGHGVEAGYIAFANGKVIRGGKWDLSHVFRDGKWHLFHVTAWPKEKRIKHLENAKAAIEKRLKEGRVD